jgi:hypothetical protein
MRALVVILVGLAVAGCSGGATPAPPAGVCNPPAAPEAFLADPPPNATGVARGVAVAFGMTPGTSATTSIRVVSSSGTIVDGGTPGAIIGIPNGAAGPPSTWIGPYALYVSQIGLLQPNTLYRVQFGVTFATSGPCAGTSWADLGSFTTGAN